jgi:hypothetical protein
MEQIDYDAWQECLREDRPVTLLYTTVAASKRLNFYCAAFARTVLAALTRLFIRK